MKVKKQKKFFLTVSLYCFVLCLIFILKVAEEGFNSF